MVTETRKQREIREREGRILQIARTQVLKGGYLGLNMDRIAAEMQYSKGTIYQHFRNKEEILLAMANQALEKRTEMFTRAASAPQRSRKRLAAVCAAAEAFLERHAEYFVVEQLIRAASIWEKTSEDRRQIMAQCEHSCMSIVSGIVRDGVAQGDLTLRAGVAPEDVVFGLWSINWGAQTIIHSSNSLVEIGIRDALSALRTNQHMMLDGHGWRPLSTEFDYLSYIDQVKRELFAQEGAEVDGQGSENALPRSELLASDR